MNIERASKIVLGIEALVLSYPTALGLLLSIGLILPLALGATDVSAALVGAAIIAGLVSGWYLTLRFFFKGRASVRAAIKCWIIAVAAAFVSATIYGLCWCANFEATHGGAYFMPVGGGFEIFGYGILFLPSFLHLSFEVWGRAA